MKTNILISVLFIVCLVFNILLFVPSIITASNIDAHDEHDIKMIPRNNMMEQNDNIYRGVPDVYLVGNMAEKEQGKIPVGQHDVPQEQVMLKGQKESFSKSQDEADQKDSSEDDKLKKEDIIKVELWKSIIGGISLIVGTVLSALVALWVKHWWERRQEPKS